MTAQPSFNPQAFRAALSTFTTGVTIITTRNEAGEPIGITANSFNSVSLNPPLVLWSLAKSAFSLPAFSANRSWNVHVLSAQQEALSGRFASRGEDKFADIQLDTGINDIPLLPACTARFQCRTAFMYEGGDHVIFVGEVLQFDKSELPPLAFQSGQYALAARKPREGVQLSSSANPPPECSYTEDLLGYLAGRAHYQLLAALRSLLRSQRVDEHAFFVLSVLSVRECLSLEEINEFVAYTGYEVTQSMLLFLEKQGYIASERLNGGLRFVLTAAGREISLEQIALAKAVEQQVVDKLGPGDAQALKIMLKRLIQTTDPGLPDLWATEPTPLVHTA
ncbi:p-hydroxyphenylacetate 3-hydroxylase, reductase component [compost metagenome]|uniref:3-hydroxy-9,10-secoandrosta-1,3,5(10)-triene-9,17-dione monooxygenase reductase component n=1 Tax=Pseudomonas jinjuensis TaxID=198616 RepID=A0A1H0R503_9PSED|nr:flavin reductase [Pseudomonas jinjuensis]SDP24557.1 3-hydroxy-9,10-secoandrosta-1,3,5(10)-triene-9,17-dione monooxygenase reductase component [Pseudomonas jinjuensis]